GEEKYRELGFYFVNERGKKPYYFDIEHAVNADKEEALRYQYHQAHLPVREQSEAAGHAVRAAYLYSGMADFARLTSDEALKAACERIWDDITQRKMYITGGVGGTHIGEAFSFAYDLPGDTAYAETCASIGMIFFAQRMLRMSPHSKYADMIERELYNIVLGGMGLDGTSFFYVNPLEVVPEACHQDSRKEHVKPVRQKWFGCACCPPNLARLISSIGSYVFTETDDTLFVHLYMGIHMEKKLQSGMATIDMQSGFPWNGTVSVHVECEAEETFTIAFRIPGWCAKYEIIGMDSADTAKRDNAPAYIARDTNLCGKNMYAISGEEKDGYLYVTKSWKSDTIQITFPMEIQMAASDTRVRETIGKVAIQRGPVVYCLEEADNGKDMHLLKVDENARFETEEKTIATESVIAVKAQGWRQRKVQNAGLYFAHSKTEYERTTLTWIPYYAWANRGEGEMQVWTRI
ncbi:MAG: glycoside hydrolase family 127 protein, partial [Lachnospiraceae bacterium]|nr:glycoside hydrolase family 127 protein [Lachnospiraceae bacterium]